MNIFEEISKYLNHHETVNIIISGVSCSGKSILAKKLQKHFGEQYQVTVVQQDEYFKNLSDIPRIPKGYLTDSIEAFHSEEFKNDVQKLLDEKVAIMPKYNIATNTRISKNKIVRKGKINIFEGLHTINLLKDLEDSIKIFVDTDINTCIKRRIDRDTTNFNIPKEIIIRHWNNCIQPMNEKYILPQKELANIILNSRGDEYNVSQTNL